MIRYRVQDLPVKGAGAFTPLPAMNPWASSGGLTHVHGSPGTEAVPAPGNAYLPSLTAQPENSVNSARGEEVTPNVIFPAIYIASAKNMGPEQHFGMAIRRRNPLPVPSRDPGRTPVPVQMRYPMGASQLPWPRAFQRWPVRGQAGSTLGV